MLKVEIRVGARKIADKIEKGSVYMDVDGDVFLSVEVDENGDLQGVWFANLCKVSHLTLGDLFTPVRPIMPVDATLTIGNVP